MPTTLVVGQDNVANVLLNILLNMKTTLKVKLLPSPEQSSALKDTMCQFNKACDSISKTAFENKCYSKYHLQAQVYRNIRETFGLSAQMTIRAISKVVESYKINKQVQHTFKPFGAIVYDERILAYKKLEAVSIWTIKGRLKISMHLGGYQIARMDRIQGQSDLVLINDVFYLLATMETPEDPPMKPKEFLGVDLGIINIATDSTGQVFSGAQVETIRQQHLNIRTRLQKKGTKSAKRHLKRRGRKESRFRKDVNHCISKVLVQKAKDTSRGIALEDLSTIRKKTTVRKSEKAKHSSWAFNQLRGYIAYKGLRLGVPVVIVDPRYTSQQCSKCSHIAKANRKTQSEFQCVQCGFSLNADHNAAINIASRALVNVPIVASSQEDSYKPTALAVGY